MTERRTGAWVSAFVTLVLSAAAAVTVIFGSYLALGRDDTEALESPLLLTITHQLIRGPWELYGPFGGENPWVIIHAPLYYRLAALVAWPLVRAGVDTVTAARWAGRSLSFLGLVSTITAANRLARLDGAPRAAGTWAALLIAASLVVGVMPYTVRPDMLGIALQTTGVLVVLSVLRSHKPRRATLVAAYTAFGLAACIKQQFIVGALVSTFLLLAACARGRLSSRLVVPGLLTGLVIVLVVYGTEELASAGQMSEAVFKAAAGTRWVHPVGWMRASIVLCGIIGRSGWLIALLAAVELAEVGAQPGFGRRALVIVGTALTSLIAVRTTLLVYPIEVTGSDLLIVITAIASTALLVIPTCWLVSLRNRPWERVDVALLVFIAAEAVLVVILSRASAGAWINYGIQGVVFASVLTARALARVRANALSPLASTSIALAALTLLIGVCADAKTTADRRELERLGVEMVINHYGGPASEFFFVDRPGLNRVNGWLNLVYDDWLYPVFEAIHLAQPRSIWLRNALTAGPIRYVVNTSDSINIDGLGQSLPELGYVRGLQLGTSFFVWRRISLNFIPRNK
jgi:hypothetical protein